MTHQEVFTKITENKKRIEELVDVTTFVLNPEVARLEQEIEELQSTCNHCFIEGVCIHCTKEEQ
jgi:DNA-binding transcriptional regulator YbjK